MANFTTLPLPFTTALLLPHKTCLSVLFASQIVDHEHPSTETWTIPFWDTSDKIPWSPLREVCQPRHHNNGHILALASGPCAQCFISINGHDKMIWKACRNPARSSYWLSWLQRKFSSYLFLPEADLWSNVYKSLFVLSAPYDWFGLTKASMISPSWVLPHWALHNSFTHLVSLLAVTLVPVSGEPGSSLQPEHRARLTQVALQDTARSSP